MNVSAPLGDAKIAPLLIRISLGAYFAYIGYIKIQDVPFFIEQLKAYLPDHLASIIGILLPYLEIFVGGLLILGLWTTLASILAVLMFASFIWATGIFPKPDIPNKDIILLCAALSLAYSGAGAVGFDTWKGSK